MKQRYLVIALATMTACSTAPNRTASNSPSVSTDAPVASLQRQGTADETFVGSYRVHGGLLKITSVTKGQLSLRSYVSCEPGVSNAAECVENYNLSLTLNEDRTLTAVITAITFKNENGERVPGPEEPAAEVGDIFRLEFLRPGLLRQTIIRGLDELEGGNPYWCSLELTAQQLDEYEQPCGA